MSGAITALLVAWQAIDNRLRAIWETAQRVLRAIRVVRAVMVVLVLMALGCALGAVLFPEYLELFFAVAVVILVIPMILLTFLVALPLRARGLVRIIDRGYPLGGRELSIRAFARKWHDESIETEELLVETALNELRKVKERIRPRRDDAPAEPGDRPPPMG